MIVTMTIDFIVTICCVLHLDSIKFDLLKFASMLVTVSSNICSTTPFVVPTTIEVRVAVCMCKERGGGGSAQIES